MIAQKIRIGKNRKKDKGNCGTYNEVKINKYHKTTLHVQLSQAISQI